MYTKRYDIALMTAADGSCTAYSPVIRGMIKKIFFKLGTLATTVDMTCTLESSGDNVWVENNLTADAYRSPRVPSKDTTNVDLTYDGTHKVCEPAFAFDERVKFVLAQGGNAMSGVVSIIVG